MKEENKALDVVADYIKSDSFKGILLPEDRKLALRIVKKLKSVPSRVNINDHLIDASRMIAESHYLVGRYESIRERNDLKAAKVKSKVERSIRNRLQEDGQRPTVALVESMLLEDKSYYACLKRSQRIKDLVRLLQAIVRGADSRFRALEQVSNNDRIAMRERD